MKTPLTTSKFIDKCKTVHGNLYDYSIVNYIKTNIPVNIKCSMHGIFSQRPNDHLKGYGCLKCAGKNRTTGNFIQLARKLHGDKYCYKNVIYKTSYNKIRIKCYKHGEFLQIPDAHLSGQGCPKCNSSKSEQKIMIYLENKKIKYIHQYSFNDFKSSAGRLFKYDFYIPSKNILIEYDGEQHFGKLKLGKYTMSMEEYEVLKLNDQLKNRYASKHKIKLVRIPYWENKKIDVILDREFIN